VPVRRPRPHVEVDALIARSRAVQSILDNIAAEADALPLQALRPLGAVLRAARFELERDLRRYFAGVDPASEFTATQWRNALVQIRGALQAIGEIEPTLVQVLRKGADQAGALAVRHVQRELREFANLYGHEIKPIPLLPAANLIIDNGARTLMQRIPRSAARYVGKVGTNIRFELAKGLVRGENMQQLVKRLVGPGSRLKLGRINSLPDAAGLISNRLFNKYTNWAATLVRTEVLNAYNLVADASIDEAHSIDPRIERRWNAANDARMCPTCGQLDHIVAGVGETFPYGDPPIHPNCRCVVVAWRSDWEEHGVIKRL